MYIIVFNVIVIQAIIAKMRNSFQDKCYAPVTAKLVFSTLQMQWKLFNEVLGKTKDFLHHGLFSYILKGRPGEHIRFAEVLSFIFTCLCIPYIEVC